MTDSLTTLSNAQQLAFSVSRFEREFKPGGRPPGKEHYSLIAERQRIAL